MERSLAVVKAFINIDEYIAYMKDVQVCPILRFHIGCGCVCDGFMWFGICCKV